MLDQSRHGCRHHRLHVARTGAAESNWTLVLTFSFGVTLFRMATGRSTSGKHFSG